MNREEECGRSSNARRSESFVIAHFFRANYSIWRSTVFMGEGKPRMLVVDEHEPWLRAFTAAAEGSGRFTLVQAALGGGQALQWFRNPIEEVTPDVVVTNLYMRDLNGIELVRLIHKTAQGFHPPCIVVSQYDGEIERLAARKIGAAGYFPKPYTSAGFLEVVEFAAAAVQQAHVRALEQRRVENAANR